MRILKDAESMFLNLSINLAGWIRLIPLKMEEREECDSEYVLLEYTNKRTHSGGKY